MEISNILQASDMQSMQGENTENSAEMEVMKYYIGLGAVGFTYKLTYENDKWNIF